MSDLNGQMCGFFMEHKEHEASSVAGILLKVSGVKICWRNPSVDTWLDVEAWENSGYDQVLLCVCFSFRPPNYIIGTHLSPLPRGLFPVHISEDFGGFSDLRSLASLVW